jgi:hypothetical protein
MGTKPRKPMLEARFCVCCGKAKGTYVYRYRDGDVVKRKYFHPKCFHLFLRHAPRKTRRA